MALVLAFRPLMSKHGELCTVNSPISLQALNLPNPSSTHLHNPLAPSSNHIKDLIQNVVSLKSLKSATRNLTGPLTAPAAPATQRLIYAEILEEAPDAPSDNDVEDEAEGVEAVEDQPDRCSVRRARTQPRRCTLHEQL
jgi:hypothetical protein